MGTQVQGRDLSTRARLLGPGELHRDPEPEPPGPDPRDPPRLPRGRLRRGRDQHLRRLADHARRVRPRRAGPSRSTARAAELAREAVAAFASDGRDALRDRRDRPGHHAAARSATSPTDASRQAFAVQAAGLIDGGVDAILIETCQDPLQIKAAVNGASDRDAAGGRRACRSSSRSRSRPPARCWSAPTSPRPRPSSARSTCRSSASTARPARRRWASTSATSAENWPRPISVLPNAGLPELVDGQDPLSARARRAGAAGSSASWPRTASTSSAAAAAPTPEHIAALDRDAAPPAEDGCRPRQAARGRRTVPSLASLYSAVPLRQENAYLSIGERCNANGSQSSSASCRRPATGTAGRDGPRAGQGGRARARRLHRLRRPRRGRRHDRGRDAPARRGRPRR